MTLEEKIKGLKKQRAALTKKANLAARKLEAEFAADGTKRPLSEKIKSYMGRYYKTVQPIVNEAAGIDKALKLLS